MPLQTRTRLCDGEDVDRLRCLSVILIKDSGNQRLRQIRLERGKAHQTLKVEPAAQVCEVARHAGGEEQDVLGRAARKALGLPPGGGRVRARERGAEVGRVCAVRRRDDDPELERRVDDRDGRRWESRRRELVNARRVDGVNGEVLWWKARAEAPGLLKWRGQDVCVMKAR